jgi:hypothetical protein
MQPSVAANTYAPGAIDAAISLRLPRFARRAAGHYLLWHSATRAV